MAGGMTVMQGEWTTLIKPKRIEFDPETLTDTYGRFSCEPLERGYGITIGNSLRRILLSSIQGAAIVSVRIEGVPHEFTAIPGVLEDVSDIILNLKGVRLKMHGDQPRILRIDKQGECEVKAGDIITDGNVEILNPDWHIATLNKDGHLKMEMKAKKGRGYVPADRNKEDGAPLGTIAMDAIFSPIRKGLIHCHKRPALVKRRIYDRLIMEITTDGSIRPEEAVSVAAQILRDQLSVFVRPEAARPQPEVEAKPVVLPPELAENLYRTVDELELSVRGCQLSEKCQHKAHRRAGSEDRGRDAQDQELWQKIIERDKGDIGGDGPFSGDAHRGL
jgi:DNA-directed RNA polymerase subunit alpha